MIPMQSGNLLSSEKIRNLFFDFFFRLNNPINYFMKAKATVIYFITYDVVKIAKRISRQEVFSVIDEDNY